MDQTHAMIERNILKQTVRLDDFFGSAKSEHLRYTTYDLRWRSSLRVDHGGDLTPGTSFRASLSLSKISERLRIFIARENEPGVTTPSLPQDPGHPGLDRTTPTAHFTNTELRYELIQKPSLNMFMGAGVRLALPFEAFVRSRIEYTRKLGDISLMRVAETFFVKNSDFLGETTEFSLQRPLSETTLLRWSSTGTASEEIEGLEWGTNLSLSWQLSPKSAVTLVGGVFGTTTTSAMVTDYQILAVYRRNFLRSWLFYELEPQVTWPRSTDGSLPAILIFTFRIEVVFQGTTGKK